MSPRVLPAPGVMVVHRRGCGAGVFPNAWWREVAECARGLLLYMLRFYSTLPVRSARNDRGVDATPLTWQLFLSALVTTLVPCNVCERVIAGKFSYLRVFMQIGPLLV